MNRPDSRGDMRSFLVWALAGCAVAAFLVATQARAVGGVAGLLSVGEASELRPVIEAELGEIPLSPGVGHDGQITYAIALDPTGTVVPEYLDHAAYRYRRILLPAIASGFGTIDGTALLSVLVGLQIAFYGVASGSLSVILRVLGRSGWAQLGVLANPGLWLSVRLLTVDVVAVGLALGGIAAWTRGKRWLSVAALTFAALTKDQYILAAVGVVIVTLPTKRRLAMAYGGIPVLALATWSAFLASRFDEAFSARGNLSAPFQGILESLVRWDAVPISDAVLGAITLLAIVACILALIPSRNRRLWPFVVPWLALAVVSSDWVWEVGNNAIRVFAPVIIWLAVAVTPRSSIEEETNKPDLINGASL